MADNNDWYINVGRQRMAEISAGRAQALANLEIAKRDNDEYGAAEAIQNIADIDQAQANLGRLYDQYARSQTPPPPPTKEERLARPWDKMTWEDAYAIAAESKHGV